jgi:hypothetical protein
MKIAVPNCGSSSKRRVAWCIISLICLLTGSYFVGRYWGLLIVLLLGVVGIMIGSVVSARLEPDNNFDQPETAPGWRDTRQIPAGWDYRPRGAIRRRADVHMAAETAADSSPSRSAVSEDVWLNALDSSALDREPTVEEAAPKAPFSGDVSKVSRYDQSPIDEQTAIAE